MSNPYVEFFCALRHMPDATEQHMVTIDLHWLFCPLLQLHQSQQQSCPGHVPLFHQLPFQVPMP